MVGVARIELATPAMSTQCSTTELHAHTHFQEQFQVPNDSAGTVGVRGQ